MESEVLEGEAGHRHQSLGDEAVARPFLIDPVADVRILERTPLHAVDVDLAREAVVGEDPEAVPGAELPLPPSRATARREGLAVVGDVGLARRRRWLPLHQPVRAAAPHLTPALEVGEL